MEDTGPHVSPDELAAYFALRTAGDRLHREVEKQLRPHGLTEMQFTILAEVQAARELRMSDLAEVLVSSKNGITYQAAQLEERGLIRRRSSDTDARSVLISLEPAGAELLRRVFPGHIDLVRELFFDRLSPEELAALTAGLDRVARPGVEPARSLVDSSPPAGD